MLPCSPNCTGALYTEKMVYITFHVANICFYPQYATPHSGLLISPPISLSTSPTAACRLATAILKFVWPETSG